MANYERYTTRLLTTFYDHDTWEDRHLILGAFWSFDLSALLPRGFTYVAVI